MSEQKIRLAICAAGELYGGVERFVSTFTEYLRDNTDIEFVVVLFYEGELVQQLRAAGIDAVTVKCRWKYNPFAVWRLVKFFRSRRISVVHTHGYLATILGAVAGKWCGARVVKTEHGKMEPRNRRDLSWLRMRSYLLADRFLTRRFVDHVVYVTRDLQSHFEGSRADERSSVIYNAISPVSRDPNAVLPEIDRRVFNIGIVGRVSEVKGHSVLIDAVARLSDLGDVQVNVLGDGPLRGQLEVYCRNHGLADKVRFLGFKANAHDYIRAFDVLVIPSLHEGLPYVLLEGMSMKVPIVASDVGGLREVLENGTDGLLVPSGNAESLAKALRHLYNSRAERERLAENAHRKVHERFMIEQMVQKYFKVFTSEPL